MRITMALIGVCTVSLCSSAGATTVTHTTFASYASALNGFDTVEDFEGFTADTSFRTSSVALAGGMSIIATGDQSGVGRNHIDVSPYAFSLIFPTNPDFAHCYVDADAASGGPREIRLDFAAPADGWRGSFGGAAGAERLSIDVYRNATLLTTYDVTDNSNGIFVAFTTPDDYFTHLILRGTTANGSATSGEGFAMDFIGVSDGPAIVPLPSAAGLSVLGLTLIAARRRR